MKSLIGQARRRQHRRRVVVSLVVVALCAAAGIAYGLVSDGGRATASGTQRFATIERAGTTYVVPKPSTGQVTRLCWAPAPNVKFSPAPASRAGWVTDSSSAVRHWLSYGPLKSCR
jgi:hypothetical protein